MDDEETPFYKRALDSFADEVITKVRQGDNGLWYAVIDVGNWLGSSADFSSCSQTQEGAVKLCATTIRKDHRGIGKYAPHGMLRPNGYEFQFKLCKWWAEKEQARRQPTGEGEGDGNN